MDTVVATVLVPMLPRYARIAHLSMAMSGALTGAFAAGVLAGAIPGAFIVARRDARAAIVVGLLTGGAASLGFGYATTGWLLFAARLGQGVGSGILWTGALAWLVDSTSVKRRGEAIGRALGAAVLGQLLGPAGGGLSALVGPRAVFAVIAMANAALVVIVVRSVPAMGGRGPTVRWGDVLAGLSDARVGGATWLVALPALLGGTLAVIAPLRLSALGVGAGVIAAMWLVSGSVEAGLSSRIGRACDRRGVIPTLRLVLLVAGGACVLIPWVGARWLLVPAVVFAATAYGCLWVPAMTNLAHAADTAGVQPGAGLALQSAWAPAHVVGTALLGGVVAQLWGPKDPFLILAGLCVITLVAIGRLPATEPNSEEAQR